MLGADMAKALKPANANNSRIQLRSVFIFCRPFLIALKLVPPIFCSAEKDEGGVPIRAGNAALKYNLSGALPKFCLG